MSKRILVTGASGFIGKNIVSYAQTQGFEVLTWKHGTHIKVENIYGVVYCAGMAHKMENSSFDALDDYLDANCHTTIKFAKKALEAGVKKFIYLSTIKVLGDVRGSASMKIYTEEDTCAPNDSYSQSKYDTEKALYELFSESKSECIILRPPMVYGPGNKGNMLTLLKCASKGIILPLGAVVGKRSMVYVGNISDALIQILNENTSHLPNVRSYFINDGLDITSAELYDHISQNFYGKSGVFYFPEKVLKIMAAIGSCFESVTSVKLPINSGVISRLFDAYQISSNKFKRDYNWEPKFSVKESLAETVRWYKESSLGKK
ncbi:MAG: NAD-dependent epimerase/dehydratase family protein [Nitrospinae bacterium]|nr:NAD-dependent epimerase/dehydratase family protein [Nitrospinota bacterium]